MVLYVMWRVWGSGPITKHRTKMKALWLIIWLNQHRVVMAFVYLIICAFFYSSSVFAISWSAFQMDPDPVLGTLGVSWEYSLDEIPVYCSALCTHSFHSFTPRGIIANLSTTSTWSEKETGEPRGKERRRTCKEKCRTQEPQYRIKPSPWNASRCI